MEVSYIPNVFSDLLVVNAARASFNKEHTTVQPNDVKLINYLVKHNHWSPLAHPHTTISMPLRMIDYEDIIKRKTLLAGLSFYMDHKHDTVHITGSLWGLLNLAVYMESTVLLGIIQEHCPISTEAFMEGLDTSKWITDDEDIHITYPVNRHKVHTFRIKAPVFVARQLVKHQVSMVWNEVSRRYVDEEPEFYYPEQWRGVASDKKQGSSNEVVNQYNPEGYDITYHEGLLTCKEWYDNNIHIAPEQRRMILPQSMYTTWIWTGTTEAWDRVLELRLKEDTQQETREVVQQIAKLLNEC